MPAPNLQWFNGNSSDLIHAANPVELGSIPRGGTQLPLDGLKQKLHLWNDKDSIAGSDTAENIRLNVLPSDGNLNQQAFLGTAGNGFQPMLQARSRGSVNVVDDAQVSWTPVSYNVYLQTGDIPRNAMRQIELRVVVPADALPVDVKQFVMQANYDW